MLNKSTCDSPRTEKELLLATRPFQEESLITSWWHVGSTFVFLASVLILATLVPWWPVRLVFSVLTGLTLVRAFIVFHDFFHNAVTRGSRTARVFMYLYGLIALTPPSSWRFSHNFHHANVGKPIAAKNHGYSLITSDIGSFPLMTTSVWNNSSKAQRLRYRISRHPVTILCAYVTVFFYTLCLSPLLSDPRKYWEGGLAILVHGALLAAVWLLAGFSVLLFALLIPFAIAGAIGAYLFFAQHNFPGMRIVPAEEWTHYRGAMESSSYMKCGAIMRWFTGNIGYHHVHHLNSLIPFYRLPEAARAVPELQNPKVTSFHPRDVLACLRLNLWDIDSQQLVSYRQGTTHT
jgi:omega-6 fatty acid desaturase (delta-12 desaturase)